MTATTVAILQVSLQKFNFNIVYLKTLPFSVTTDSQTSEEDSIPPPLPLKHRDSDYGAQGDISKSSLIKITDETDEDCYQSVASCPLPVAFNAKVVSNMHYEVLELRKREVVFSSETKTSKKSPPTPPPKPARTSRGSFSP